MDIDFGLISVVFASPFELLKKRSSMHDKFDDLHPSGCDVNAVSLKTKHVEYRGWFVIARKNDPCRALLLIREQEMIAMKTNSCLLVRKLTRKCVQVGVDRTNLVGRVLVP